MFLQFHNTGRLKAEVTHNQQLLYSIKFNMGLKKRGIEIFDTNNHLIGIINFPSMLAVFNRTMEYPILDPTGNILGMIIVNQRKDSFTINYQGKTLEDTNYRLEDSVMKIDLNYQDEPVVTVVKSASITKTSSSCTL